LEHPGWDRDPVHCPGHPPGVEFGRERNALLLEILISVRAFVPLVVTVWWFTWTWWNSPAGAATDTNRLAAKFPVQLRAGDLNLIADLDIRQSIRFRVFPFVIPARFQNHAQREGSELSDDQVEGNRFTG
jgi:hypothetical protein